jgi:hypothetical protein
VTDAVLPVFGNHSLFPLEAGDASSETFNGSSTGPAAQLMNFTANLNF